MIVLKIVSIVVISYLLGSLNFSIIVSRRCFHKDIRENGSHNAGATNMLRTNGKKYAVLTFLGDVFKLFVAILIAYLIIGKNDFSSNAYLFKSIAGLACVIGHMYPCFFSFKGGKGVSVCAGMVLAIDWRIALILLVIFALVVLATKYVSLGSIIIAICYPVLTYIFFNPNNLNLGATPISEKWIATIIAIVFTLIVVIKHSENIKRLFNGTESKISKKNK